MPALNLAPAESYDTLPRSRPASLHKRRKDRRGQEVKARKEGRENGQASELGRGQGWQVLGNHEPPTAAEMEAKERMSVVKKPKRTAQRKGAGREKRRKDRTLPRRRLQERTVQEEMEAYKKGQDDG